MKDRDWIAQAACKGKPVEWWFAPDGTNLRREWERTERPKGRAVCARCPVRDVCLTEHSNEPFGVWGGFDKTERDEIRKGRKDPKDLRLAVCPRGDCALAFATVYSWQLYCSTTCEETEKKRRARAKAERARLARAKRKAEERGEMFDPTTLKPHTYLVARVDQAKQRKQGEAS